MNLYRVIEKTTQKFPKNLSLIFEKQKITYHQLKNKIDVAASYLKQYLQKEDKVILCIRNSPYFIINFFAISKNNAIVIPINFLLEENEIEYIVNDSQSKLIISDREFAEKILEVQKKLNIKVIFTDDISKYIQASIFEYEDTSDDQTAMIIYTSGTTGKPKGAMLTHKNLTSNVSQCLEVFNVTPKDNILCFLPMFHSFAFTVCVLIPLTVGCRITIFASVKELQNKKKFFKTMFFGRITFFVGIPAVFNLLCERLSALKGKILFFWTKVAVSGADALSPDVWLKFEKKFKLPLCEGFGLTEASPVVSVNPQFGKRKIGTVGPPLPGVKIRIVDDDGNDLPIKKAGEILVYGDNVMKGYYNKPKETEESFYQGWLKTGDVGLIDEDGYLKIVDRKKDLIISKGLNIYPKEIENVILELVQIKEVAVVGERDTWGDEYPVAFVSLQENQTITSDEIITHCKRKLSSYKVPRRIIFIQEFPKTTTLKIKKNELRQLLKSKPSG